MFHKYDWQKLSKVLRYSLHWWIQRGGGGGGGGHGVSRPCDNLRLRGPWFETHQRHCVVYLSKTLYPLLNTGSFQEMF